MIWLCSECGREHLVEGSIAVDGQVLGGAALECMLEIFCRHGVFKQPAPPLTMKQDPAGPEFPQRIEELRHDD